MKREKLTARPRKKTPKSGVSGWVERKKFLISKRQRHKNARQSRSQKASKGLRSANRVSNAWTKRQSKKTIRISLTHWEHTRKGLVRETQGTWQTGGEHREIGEDIKAAVLTTAEPCRPSISCLRTSSSAADHWTEDSRSYHNVMSFNVSCRGPRPQHAVAVLALKTFVPFTFEPLPQMCELLLIEDTVHLFF